MDWSRTCSGEDMDLLELTFLGTASAVPTPTRCVSCTALRHDEGVWLFDCGECSQVQIMKSQIKSGKISKIFITHLHGDHLFGLPGLLCTMSQNNQRDEPVELYGPLGLRHYICTALCHSRSDLNFDFIVHELQPLDVQLPDNIEEWPCDNNKLSIPFHPKEKKGSLISADENQIWQLHSDTKLSVQAVWVKHRIPSFSFVIKESAKPGKLNAELLKSKGVPPGPLYAKLKSGQCITTDQGQIISPSDVLGQPIPGRTLVISGDSCDSYQLFKVAKGASVLVHEATLENSLQDQCVKNGHSTPAMTASLAKQLDVKLLIITHVSARYKPLSAELKDGDQSAKILVDEACEIFEDVLLAEDLLVYRLPPSDQALHRNVDPT
ncbi:zinc phosphodiesterase ELAC protein 1-like isoform X3 [Physella acuta]|uniref:zinc phosphodiesterase ELAC protein 1-like isoform X3 n=1 Tax=Physella acuta TaxID=109671 RepID=UPI0027DB9816|nr:zinc phosphodiesterase ELAC protein 1-like isoform X3 [Physella acuta]